jgi:hypothetical protein
MLTEHEARPGAGGRRPLEDHGIVGDLSMGPLVGMDDSIDWSSYLNLDCPNISPAFLDRSPRGAFGLFDSAQYDDDGVLDQWLASMAPDQFERAFDCLASLQDGPLNSLEPTA